MPKSPIEPFRRTVPGSLNLRNANIAEYHVPVNADMHDIKVNFVDEPDDSNRPGIKAWARLASSASLLRSPMLSFTRQEARTRSADHAR